jgi:cell envelope opacity-associated protein A
VERHGGLLGSPQAEATPPVAQVDCPQFRLPEVLQGRNPLRLVTIAPLKERDETLDEYCRDPEQVTESAVKELRNPSQTRNPADAQTATTDQGRVHVYRVVLLRKTSLFAVGMFNADRSY